LYEYYKSAAKELPDTLEEMAPLFAAVMHGCQAGRHEKALDEVYWKRITRGQEFFNTKKLDAFGADLAALSGFFELPWRQPIATLREDAKGFVLSAAGFDLRALGRLAEAAQPMQASLDAYIVQENWKATAITASNLSELYLTIGDLRQALNYARQSGEWADRSGDAFERMARRTTLADALHQAGHLAEAETAFREAEEIQKQREPEFPRLYSLWGFRYCDLLLSQGKVQEVQRRVAKFFEWRQPSDSLLGIALENLSLGRALIQTFEVSETSKVSQTLTHLTRVVDGLRQAGTQDMLPHGLLARAEFYRVTGALEKAQRDLDEAFSIATRGGMGLHLADCHLAYARLALASRGRDVPTERLYADAREHLAIAKKMIAEMGYHRRDREVEELEAVLKT
jgi:tetratricopeptide (TPR) repeat protein